MSQTLAVYGPNLRDQSQGSFQVHDVDCADCKKLDRCEDRPHVHTYEDLDQVVILAYDPGDFDYDPETDLDAYAQDFHFNPCVKLQFRS